MFILSVKFFVVAISNYSGIIYSEPITTNVSFRCLYRVSNFLDE
ncbi:hypothetical protein [Caldicellulosiruptor naganoensis]|uniref:Uncharacterized protein n=1 Tax=Caldicellulosiruptor naganoensis TaxID=29324 RepID=A0ABY7BJY4_9FIRM|nr:hypothetical protein [Caldicellulosiruptor naganoensis]WAM31659.1 hypothetical protein OTJ99_000090 [Caldicellulosiruptor naganoensis]